jgi:hypothetical protein
MRAVGAIVLYVLAAASGLSVGYLATAPRTTHERARTREAIAAERQYEEELSEMEAAAALLAAQEAHGAQAVPARADGSPF